MITAGPTDPTPQLTTEERVQKDREQLLRLITTLQQSYTSNGVLAWLVSKNANLHRQAPIQVWLDGERQAVLDVADLIDGGLPAAPSAQPGYEPEPATTTAGTGQAHNPAMAAQPDRDTEEGRR